MDNFYVDLPVIDGSTSSSWKQPVNVASALPINGNADGDTRVVLSNYSLWTWSASQSKWLKQFVYTPTKSLTLDGVSKSVTAGQAFAYDITSTFSISLWLKLPSTVTSGAILSKESVGPVLGWEIFCSDGTIDFGFFGNGTSAYVYNTVALSANTWYNIIFTYDGSQTAAGMKMYVNGALRALTVGANTWAGSVANSALSAFGSRGGTSAFLNCLLDEISFYNVVLTLGQTATIYNGGTPFDLNTLSFYSSLTNWYKVGDAPDNYTTLYDSGPSQTNATGVNLANPDFTTDIA